MEHTLINLLQDPKCLVVINHSGGKDSQAMYLTIKDIVPKERIVVIHAHLKGVEWEGTIEHIENTISNEFHVVEAKKSFFEMVEKRGMFPSPKYRQCTSDLKVSPIRKRIKHLTNTRGYTSVLNCMGLRAQESSQRSKKIPFTKLKSESNSKRDWYEWLPIHSLKTNEVFEKIRSHNQKPHWAYSKGMTRLSCVFCIMASEHDLSTAAKHNPTLLDRYDTLEKKVDHTMIMPTKTKGKRNLLKVIEDYHIKQNRQSSQLSFNNCFTA